MSTNTNFVMYKRYTILWSCNLVNLALSRMSECVDILKMIIKRQDLRIRKGSMGYLLLRDGGSD